MYYRGDADTEHLETIATLLNVGYWLIVNCYRDFENNVSLCFKDDYKWSSVYWSIIKIEDFARKELGRNIYFYKKCS